MSVHAFVLCVAAVCVCQFRFATSRPIDDDVGLTKFAVADNSQEHFDDEVDSLLESDVSLLQYFSGIARRNTSGVTHWPNMPTRFQNRQHKRRIFYVRNPDGLNNVKAMFFTMVALAAVFDRELVLNPPGYIDHVPFLFSESDVWDLSEGASPVHIRMGMEPVNDDTFAVGDKFDPRKVVRWSESEGFLLNNLKELDLATLPSDKDWFFPPQWMHFECLQLSPEQEKVAARAVLQLKFRNEFVTGAHEALFRLGLQNVEFDSVHLRRGDFASNSNRSWMLGLKDLMLNGSEIAAALDRQSGATRPILVASDTGDRDGTVDQLRNSSSAPLVLSTNDAFHDYKHVVIWKEKYPLARIIMDQLMLAAAKTYTGTPISSFSLGIGHIRSALSVRSNLTPPPMFYYMNLELPEKQALNAQKTCSMKETTFCALLDADCHETVESFHYTRFCETPDCSSYLK